jgi:hypothetical protein
MLSVEIDILSNICIISYIVIFFEVLIVAKLADGDISARSGFEAITLFSGQYIELLTTTEQTLQLNSVCRSASAQWERVPLSIIASREVHGIIFLVERVARCLDDERPCLPVVVLKHDVVVSTANKPLCDNFDPKARIVIVYTYNNIVLRSPLIIK